MAIDLTVVTWIWGKKYSSHYISRLHRGITRHLRQSHRFLVLTPYPTDDALWKGCFCRLRMFSTSFQRHHAIEPGTRVVCLDLDVVITGGLDPLFDRDESLVILQGANAANPCPFNGSVIMFRAGERCALWDEFSPERASKIPYYQFPDDQGWIYHMFPFAPTWQCGPASGIYAFRKPGWPKDDKLPADARIVAFPGARDPSQFQHLPWLRECWR